MPPVNTTAETAFPITLNRPGTFTTSVNVRDGGVNYDTWWKVTPTFTGMIGVWFLGDNDYVYAPESTLFSDAGITQPFIGAFGQVFAAPHQIPVVRGEPIWFWVDAAGGNPASDGFSTLHVSIISAPHAAVYPAGSVFITDDSSYTPEFPGILYSPSGEVLGFAPIFSGDSGDVLLSGRILMESFATAGCKIYDANMVELFDVALEPIGVKGIRACLGGDCWYLRPVTAVNGVHRVGSDGTVWPEIDTGRTTVNFAVSNDETTLYHAGAGVGAAINRWNIPGAVADSDLVAGIPAYNIQGILVLTDDSIVVGYYDPGGGADATMFKRYSAAGATLNTYTAGDDSLFLMSYDDPDDEAFWYWTQTLTPKFEGRFRRIRISDGVVISDFTREQVADGTNTNVDTADTPDRHRFGNETSCPFMVLRQPLLAGDDSGGVIGPLVWVHMTRRT